MVIRCILTFFFFCGLSHAQDLSGLWVHDINGTDPVGFNQIYAIIYLDEDDSGNVKGYTYDYHAGSTCSFYLEGDYDPEKNRLIVANTKKINKALLHARGRYKLSYEVSEDEEFLIGRARQKGIHGFVLSFGGLFSVPLKYRKIKSGNFEDIKGYDKLKPYIDTLEVNSKKELKVDLPLEETTIDDIKETREVIEFTKEKENRKNELISSHKVTSRKITMEIFDNSRQDGDRISIYINDRLFTYNLEVTLDPKTIELMLPEDQNVHKVSFVANNVGRVPPNTAKIKYKVDGISYELVLFTNLNLNKYLEFVIDKE
ncbi:hypothetical protein [Winogradskyella sp.]|uniref:hypothetical protein n=1 Tax=Winogradskyella sp. TaxID=1883156 RepID=UPI003BA9C26D